MELLATTVDQLQEHGIGRGDRVAMVLPNDPEMATAFLAVASTATAAPPNPAYQAAEFEFDLSDLEPRALIVEAGSDSAACAVAVARGIPLIFLTLQRDAKAGQFTLTGEVPGVPKRSELARAEDIGLVLHTSGTTSKPKIEPLTQANLCASAAHIAAALRLSKHDRGLNVMPLFHIHGLIAATLAPLSAGGSVVCTTGFPAAHLFTVYTLPRLPANLVYRRTKPCTCQS